MVASFKGLQSAVSKQMTEHNKYKTANADKFATINKKVDIDMKKTLKDMNITSDDLNKRVHMLQKEQVEPLQKSSDGLQEAVESLKQELTDYIEKQKKLDEEGANNLDRSSSMNNRRTPMGQNMEDQLDNAKEEMKTYIEEQFQVFEDANKKKMDLIEMSLKRAGGVSPTGAGRGLRG